MKLLIEIFFILACIFLGYIIITVNNNVVKALNIVALLTTVIVLYLEFTEGD